jgi:ribonucleotide monophosphatase NagD (HAD superfamily)
MIGDNPKGDIYGANLMGWESILVETGIYRPNDHLGVGETPKHHVKDMSAALSLIL